MIEQNEEWCSRRCRHAPWLVCNASAVAPLDVVAQQLALDICRHVLTYVRKIMQSGTQRIYGAPLHA